jgi:predicted ArsR family transcriptional regulator
MQPKRQQILDHLKANGPATVEALADLLRVSPVTVRHHLDILRTEELVGEPIVRRKTSRGRPQHVFALTEKAATHFPKRYDDLAGRVLDQLKAHGDPRLINVIFEGVTASLIEEAPRPAADMPVERRLAQATAFLTERGYVARWEPTESGYLLHTCNCPYATVAPQHEELCQMDTALVSTLLGFEPERQMHLVDGDSSCSYFVPSAALTRLSAE